MSKKATSVLRWIVCIVFLCVGLFFLSTFFGNPISAALVRSNAKRYLTDNLPNTDFKVSEIHYDPKIEGYYAEIVSPSSIDSHFLIYFDLLGRYSYDNYENTTNGGTTFSRLYLEYQDLLESTFAACPMNITISGGQLRAAGLLEIYDFVDENGERRHYTLTQDFGLDMSTLVLDGEYNLHELGRDYGWLYVYIEDSEVSLERATELLLDLKAYMDQKGIAFHAVDFNLRFPSGGDGQMPDMQITLIDFLYSDIYVEGLTERIEASWNIAQEHHAIQDGLKKEADLLVPYFIEIPVNSN